MEFKTFFLNNFNCSREAQQQILLSTVYLSVKVYLCHTYQVYGIMFDSGLIAKAF